MNVVRQGLKKINSSYIIKSYLMNYKIEIYYGLFQVVVKDSLII